MTEERMEFKAEVSKLLELVVHSLYSDKEIFLRELISNASDACDKLRYEAITTPELTDDDDAAYQINITTDPKDRTITISDNGIGMKRDELIENLGTIAQSGTSAFLKSLEAAQKGDVTQIGQFGVGFYAAFMVAQMVEVTSRHAGTEEAWCWRSDGKGEFAVEEAKREDRGTSITIYLKQGEDEFLNSDRIKAIVKLYSDHIALPIYLNEDEEALNHASALWLRNKSEITPEQYKEFYHHAAHATDEPALTLHWKAEGAIEYSNLLFVPSVPPYDLFDPKRAHGVKLYVKRVFITADAEGLIPPYLRFMRGVIDSEDLPLNISREMLQNNPMMAKIRQGVTKRVLKELVSLTKKEEEYAKFWGNFGGVLKEGVYEDTANRDDLLSLIRCNSTHGDKMTSLADYVARMKDGQENIYYINGDNLDALKLSPHLEGFKARGIEVLLLTETVDDFWPSAVGVYEGKNFMSVTRAGQDLDKVAPLEDKKDKKDEDKAPEGAVASLIAFMKLTLGDTIKDVRTSDRLTNSPVCLASDEGDIDIHLEKFLKQHNQVRTASVRILEINPSHPLISKMANTANDEGDKDGLDDMTWLLLDQARLMDGEDLSDPVGFSKRLSDVLAKII